MSQLLNLISITLGVFLTQNMIINDALLGQAICLPIPPNLRNVFSKISLHKSNRVWRTEAFSPTARVFELSF